jgi:hypothetical protein
MRIRSIVGIEFHQQLSLFPFIPYGLSLSMSVAYRQLRQSKLAMHRTRAQTDFQTSCTLLQELGNRFWSAEAMARLGQRTMREMDKATSHAEHRHKRRHRKSVHNQATGQAPTESFSAQILPRAETSEDATQSHQTQYQSTATHENDSSHQITSETGASFSPVPPSSGTGFSEGDILSPWDANFSFDDIDAVFGGQLDLCFPTNFEELLMMGDPLSV